MKDSFYQIILDESSSKLCTFVTPFGRYRFKRLPFGINTAAEICQRKNTEIFGNILNNGIYIDDLIIATETEKEHDSKLKQVLEAARLNGITFNANKFQFKKSEVKLLGFVVSNKGIKIDPERTEAISKMEIPKNKKELHIKIFRFSKILGKILSKFVIGNSTLKTTNS